MRLGLATGAVLVAFAANSVLNRAAVGPGLIAPADFAMLRLVSGALVLAALARGLGFRPGWRRLAGAAALILYLAGFSVAYLALAVVSGAVTSGLGYALWYAVLQQLGAARAAVAQLAVPLIAAAGGLVLLDEPLGWRLAPPAAMILGGVARGLSRGGRSG
ncbi:MAG: EamA family transporter [Rhodobacterales bacterium]|nr:EamA family transporter [Rhodobacterales bacterium]